MLNLQEIKETRVYQEAKQEGIQQGKLEGIEEGKREGIEEGMLRQKLAMIPLLQELGLTIKQIAQRLEISETLVKDNIK